MDDGNMLIFSSLLKLSLMFSLMGALFCMLFLSQSPCPMLNAGGCVRKTNPQVKTSDRNAAVAPDWLLRTVLRKVLLPRV